MEKMIEWDMMVYIFYMCIGFMMFYVFSEPNRPHWAFCLQIWISLVFDESVMDQWKDGGKWQIQWIYSERKKWAFKSIPTSFIFSWRRGGMTNPEMNLIRVKLVGVFHDEMLFWGQIPTFSPLTSISCFWGKWQIR